MPKTNAPSDPIFSIVFSKGLAVRNRLPLAHVLATLLEIEKMIREVGIHIQRANGVDNPTGDFGIELLATEDGIAFHKGSVKAHAAITRDIKNGLETVSKIIDVTDTVEKKRVRSVDAAGEPILRRLIQVGKIQEKDNTEMGLRLATARRKPKEANFSQVGIQTLNSMRSAELAVEAITVYGKLKSLADYSEDDEGRFFWGELREDGGKDWRIRFQNRDLGKVQKLFTKQVAIYGDATYFKIRSPRIDVRTIAEDRPRDYEAAFGRFRRNYGSVFGNSDPQKILEEVRG